ncbi:MAG: hypothetical protein AAGF67_13105 [Verrucomicrobiota bacterium]
MIPTIRQSGPDLLSIRFQPTLRLWLIYVGFGLAFLVCGIFTVALLGTSNRLSASAEGVRYEQKSLLGNSYDWTLSREEIVSVRLMEEKNGAARIYRVALFDDSSKTPFLAKFPNLGGDEKRALIEELKSVLNSGEGSLERSSDTRWVGGFLGLVCIAGGIWCLLAIQVGLIRADRKSGRVRLRVRRLLWPGPGRTRDVALSDIRGVRKSRHRATTHSGGEVVSYQVCLVGRANEQIPVALDAIFTEKSANLITTALEDWFEGDSQSNDS